MFIISLFLALILLFLLLVSGAFSTPGAIVIAAAAAVIGFVWHRARQRRGRRAM